MKNTIPQADWTPKHGEIALQKLIKQTREWGNSRHETKRTLRTTDATPGLIWDELMPAVCLWEIEFQLLAYATDASAARYYGSRTLRRGASGTAPVALAANNARTADYEDVAGWTYSISYQIDGSVEFYVTGDATRTVDWVICTSILEAP